jgi:hypothetical protein
MVDWRDFDVQVLQVATLLGKMREEVPAESRTSRDRLDVVELVHFDQKDSKPTLC